MPSPWRSLARISHRRVPLLGPSSAARWLPRASEGDSPIFVERKSGQSPAHSFADLKHCFCEAVARRRGICAALAMLLILSGCVNPFVVSPARKKSLLQPAQMSADSVSLDMFFVRFPFGDSKINETLWNEIDEQHFPADLRERLLRNGFRVGIVSNPMPVELEELLELGDNPAPAEEQSGTKATKLDEEPRVLRRFLQLPAQKRGEVIASGVYPQLPVLVSASGQLSGQTYQQAQGIFAVKSFPQPDGRVRLELVPELHYGQPRQRWVGDQGMMRLEAGRAKRVYDDMTIAAEFAPGTILVLSSLPNRQGSLGHYFFTENDGRLQQKLLLIRLAQTQHDGLFNPPEPLKLDQ
jgi:hypothetical protein